MAGNSGTQKPIAQYLGTERQITGTKELSQSGISGTPTQLVLVQLASTAVIIDVSDIQKYTKICVTTTKTHYNVDCA